MIAKLSDEQRQALAQQPDQPLPVEDPQTKAQFVLISRDVFLQMEQALAYDDSDVTAEERLELAQRGLKDPEGWGAPGMEVYDDYQPPQYDPPRKKS